MDWGYIVIVGLVFSALGAPLSCLVLVPPVRRACQRHRSLWILAVLGFGLLAGLLLQRRQDVSHRSNNAG